MMKRGKNYENRYMQLGDQIYYGGGHLHVTDEKGSYSIPVGRKTRRTLCVLKEKPGMWKQCIEIDLITGRIYLSVDHDYAAGDVYYYDMASEKLWNGRLLRLLRTAARSGMVLEDNLRKVIVRLPNDNWKEMLLPLPGWQEEYDHRLDNLMLPQGKVEEIRWPETEDAGQQEGETAAVATAAPAEASAGQESKAAPAEALAGQESKAAPAEASAGQGSKAAPAEAGAAQGSEETAAAAENTDLAAKVLGGSFSLQNKDGVWELHYADQTAGGEFFGNSEEHLRFLTEKELQWVLYILREKETEEARELLIRFLRREIEIV